MVAKIRQYFGGNLKDLKIAVWGLSFKPNTDDIREAPALYIIEQLLQDGADITVFDPESMKNVEAIFGNKIKYAANQYDATENADALVIMTEWNVFRSPNFERMAQKMKRKIIFDGRNLYAVNDMEGLGFAYTSIGRNHVNG